MILQKQFLYADLKHLFLLEILKIVVLFNIFVETTMLFSEFFDEYKRKNDSIYLKSIFFVTM